MPRCARRLLRLVLICLFEGGALFWARLAAAADGTAVPTHFAVWDKSLDLRAGLGYKDNVLLGSANKEGSAFETAGLDLMLVRLSTSGAMASFFLTGDDTRYFQAKDVSKEQSLSAQGQWKQSFGNDWKVAFTVQYFYQDEVYDASIAETNFTAVRARGHDLSVSPSLRRELGRHYWLELELAGQRQWFAAPLQHYWQGGPKLTAGRDLAGHSNLTLSYSLNRRRYDDFNQIALDETPIPGTTAAFWIHQVELAWHQDWDQKRRWRSTLRLVYGINRDNGPGFFDYQSYRLVQQLRYRASSWQVEGRVGVSRYDFDRQTVSLTDESKRRKTDVVFSLRGERKIGKSLKAFADYEYERSLSNLAFDNYQVNQVTAGVDWEF